MVHRRFEFPWLHEFVVKVLCTYGMSVGHATIVSETLLAADLMGLDSHGIVHLAEHFAYIPGIESKMVNVQPNITETQLSPVITLIDGDCAMGIIAFNRGVKTALAAAQNTGIGLGVVRNSFHAGALACHVRHVALQGCIGIAFTNTGAITAPTFGRCAAVGSNPIAIGIPSLSGRPLLLDMATSVVAGGKIENARREGRQVPPGWIVDSDGKPSINPYDFFEGGALLPLGSYPELGSHKGYGLGVMVDVLTGVLSGMGHSLTLGTTGGQAHTILCLSVRHIRHPEDFERDVNRMIDDLHQVVAVSDNQRVMVPGEREWTCMEDRLENGIPLSSNVIDILRKLAIRNELYNYVDKFHL